MSPTSDDSFPEWNPLGASKLVELQWIRPDWPVCLLGHEASKRPSCHARSRLSVMWVKLFFFECAATVRDPGWRGKHITLLFFFPQSCAALVFRRQDTRMHPSLRAECSSAAVGEVHAETGSSYSRRRAARPCDGGAPTNYQ